MRLQPVATLLAALALTGCKLVDQTTFYAPKQTPAAAAKPAPPPAAPQTGALLTIDLTGGEPDYETQLAEAVREALAAKPDIIFQVVSMVPQKGTEVPTWDQAEAVTVWGRRVADRIAEDGVQTGQIELGLKVTPGLDHGEIRVYVR